MSFCGRRRYIDVSGKCHNIVGKTVHEIEKIVKDSKKSNNGSDLTFGSNSDGKMCGPDKYCDRREYSCKEKGEGNAPCNRDEHCKGFCWNKTKCHGKRKNGEGCERDEQCKGFCNYNTKKCNNLKPSELNYGCNRDAQCEGWCHVKKGKTEGVCKKLKIPNPDSPVDVECDRHEQCQHHCISGACSLRPGETTCKP